ncbi:TonB family protein [candidate division KSB1 bacterium]
MLKYSERPGIINRRFLTAKKSPKHPAVDDREKAGLYIQSGLIAVMVLFTILAFAFKQKEYKTYVFIPPDFIVNVDLIPETTASSSSPPPKPSMPTVPVEAEQEEILDEIEWEAETLDFMDLPALPQYKGPVGGIGRSPRPLYDRFPEYPDSERKKGHEGAIDVNIFIDENGKVAKVEVIRNTTNSSVLEDAAVQAAYKTVYQPALDRSNRPIPSWTIRTYSFGIRH